MKREQIKALIELSTSYKEADGVIETYTGYKEYPQKNCLSSGNV